MTWLLLQDGSDFWLQDGSQLYLDASSGLAPGSCPTALFSSFVATAAADPSRAHFMIA